MIKRIGILTSGGDAPGMNAALRAVVKKALNHGLEVFGVYNGYAGLVKGDIKQLSRHDVGEKINRGGTFLGSARLPEFADIEVRKKGVAQLEKYGIEALVVIGGDGSFMGAKKLTEMGINCIGIPGTIDNDIVSTDYTIGFDTALNTVIDAIDKLRDTSSSHYRCNIVEIMGRHCGDLALNAGLASGAEYVVVPEVGYDEEQIIKEVEEAKKRGKKHFIILITEKLTDVRELAKKIESTTGIETRATVIGHIQRGGAPTAFDRILASRMGANAVELLMGGQGGRCICIRDNKYTHEDIYEALEMPRRFNEQLYKRVIELD